MEAVLLIGTQASGKTSLYEAPFAATHLRLSLDVLCTRRREAILLRACLGAGQRFVLDNPSPTRAERARYLEPALAVHFCTIRYHVDVPVPLALARDALRTGRARIPDRTIWATAARREPPGLAEGSRALYRATPASEGDWMLTPLTGTS